MQTLILEFEAVVFEKDELGHQDMSILGAQLSLLSHQDSDLNIGNKSYHFQIQTVTVN